MKGCYFCNLYWTFCLFILLSYYAFSRVELARYPGHKRHAPDVISEKENAPNFHNELYSGKYDRGLRLINVNHEQHTRYGERPRNGFGGLR